MRSQCHLLRTMYRPKLVMQQDIPGSAHQQQHLGHLSLGHNDRAGLAMHTGQTATAQQGVMGSSRRPPLARAVHLTLGVAVLGR